ncbi:MAG: type III-B CRISPR module RAMP protein Cmr6, partial [Ktedonobacteraceae bacterium]|nr:type III-B CRISPR module RAMP protein Cmr6 [Ktedonobacteraceae bacterium]
MPISYRQPLNDIYVYQHGQFDDFYKKRPKQPNEKNTLEIHAGLWLDKYIEKQERDDVGVRAQLVREVATIAEPAIYEPFYNSWKKILEGEHGARTREARTKGRMVVGLGSESVLKTSIALHRTYGMPYIPGSSLKGLVASYVRNYLSDEWREGNESKFFNILLGNTKGAGYITFFDALYVPGSGGGAQNKALYSDVITVHHQQYYQSGTSNPPADWDSPIPIPFLSATGTYLLALAAPDMERAHA